METVLLKCRSMSKHYGAFTAVNNVDLQLDHKEFLVLLGPSGCGKTTMLRMIAGLETLNTGEILLQNQVVSDAEKLVVPEKRGLGMVFQNNSLFPHLNVFDNVGYGLKGSKKEKQHRIEEMLALVNLPDSARKMPHMLSGGQQQRVAIARALAPSPKLLLLDEPFNSLDYQLRVQMRQDIRDILKKEEVSVILVTHDQAEAYTFADRLVVVNQGKIAQEGLPSEVYHNPINSWVAAFVGETNFLPVEIAKGFLDLDPQDYYFADHKRKPSAQETSHQLMVRPSNIVVERASGEEAHGIIQHVEFSGDQQVLKINLHKGHSLKARVSSQEKWHPKEPLKIMIQHFVVYPN